VDAMGCSWWWAVDAMGCSWWWAGWMLWGVAGGGIIHGTIQMKI